MLKITIPSIEHFNEISEEFVVSKEQTLHLEHSLVSLSKWESKWLKPFLSKEAKTIEETTDYIQCMTITQNVDPTVYLCITNENLKDVNVYIDAPMTATTFKNDKKGRNKDIITSEVIYHWMVSLNIPFECQKWHLNRLLTLIQVCNIKNTPPKKGNKKELMNRNKSLNASRRQALNSRG